jgi:acyl-CoA synthetase (AMP-forming)/AMP-acid ligase II
VTQSPDVVGFRFEKKDYTNAAVGALVGRVRESLKRDGAESGARIAAFMYNSPTLLALFMACAMDGLVFCPINVALRRSDLAYTLGDIDPYAVFFDAELAEVYVPASSELSISRVTVVGETEHELIDVTSFDARLAAAEGVGAYPSVSPSDPLCIIYSGGPTGLPKGIVIP